MFLTLRAGLRSLPRELIEAALSTGASRFRILRTIVVPLMTPPLVAGVALTFVSCIGNFGIPAFLGIPGSYIVLPTLIYQRLSGLGPSVLSEVSSLSVIAGTIAIAGILLQNYMLSRRDYRITGNFAGGRPVRPGALAPAGRDPDLDLHRLRPRHPVREPDRDLARPDLRRAG